MNGYSASRSRLRCPACRTTADRMAARLQPARRHVHLYSDGFTRWRGGNPQCFRMTYAWSGFHIVRLGENPPAQSVGKPDLQNESPMVFRLCKTMSSSQHVYEIRPRKDGRGLDLISERLPLGVLWFEGADAIGDAFNYARAFSYPHPAIIRVLNESRTFAVTLESVADFSRPVDISARPLRHCLMSSSQ